MADNRPIGVFDSGMGGLSVWSVMRQELPYESLIYYGDGENCPYGTKPSAEVFGYIIEGIERLLEKDVKMIVLACNTATMIAIDELRGAYDIPFVGMEPAIKPAAATTESGIVGVLATKTSLQSEWFTDLVSRYGAEVEIITGEGKGFVRIVEEDRENDEDTLQTVKNILSPMIEKGADRIVLGCTHYPLLIPRMREAVGDRDIEFIDPAPAITRRVGWLLDEYGIKADKGNKATYEFLTAADDGYLKRLESKASACACK